MEYMFGSGIELDLVCYNNLINLYCKEGKFKGAYNLLDEAESRGLKCDQYTHTILIDGLCKASNIKVAQRHLKYMSMMGFHSHLIALNCFIDVCKLGQIDYAMQVFESMKIKDGFTYSSLVHGLCMVGKFHAAAKLLLSCIRGGMKFLSSDKWAVISGLHSSGFIKDAKKFRGNYSSDANKTQKADIFWKLDSTIFWINTVEILYVFKELEKFQD